MFVSILFTGQVNSAEKVKDKVYRYKEADYEKIDSFFNYVDKHHTPGKHGHRGIPIREVADEHPLEADGYGCSKCYHDYYSNTGYLYRKKNKQKKLHSKKHHNQKEKK